MGLTQPKRLAWRVRTAPTFMLCSPTINFRCGTNPTASASSTSTRYTPPFYLVFSTFQSSARPSVRQQEANDQVCRYHEQARENRSVGSGESRILCYRGQVLSDGVKHILFHYFNSDLQVNKRMFSAIFRKLSGLGDPEHCRSAPECRVQITVEAARGEYATGQVYHGDNLFVLSLGF
jgi:hypothetical protein